MAEQSGSLDARRRLEALADQFADKYEAYGNDGDGGEFALRTAKLIRDLLAALPAEPPPDGGWGAETVKLHVRDFNVLADELRRERQQRTEIIHATQMERAAYDAASDEHKCGGGQSRRRAEARRGLRPRHFGSAVMSRSNYSDDYGDDYPNQLELYRANVERAMGSKAGRAKLAELLAALDAMPVKALAADVFIDSGGETVAPGEAPMCALGVWAAAQIPERAARLFANPEPEADEMARTLKAFGWPPLVVHDIVFWNDDRDYDRWETAHGPLNRDQEYQYRYGPPWGPRIRIDLDGPARWARVRRNILRALADLDAAAARRAEWQRLRPCTTPSPAGVGLL